MSILDSDFIPQHVWAEAHHLAVRTVERYRRQPDGLPYCKLGRTIYIPKEAADEWILSRVTRRNPRRAPRSPKAARKFQHAA